MLTTWAAFACFLGARASAFSDECDEDGCAFSALQRRAAQLSSDLEEALEEKSVTGPPSFALCDGKSYDKSQENCCGGSLYSLTSQGCCGNKSVYTFAQQGCCNDDHVFTYGVETCVPTKPGVTPDTSFSCAADWPPPTYSAYWLRYCAAGMHMAWAMTPSCDVGWLSVKQNSLEDAEKKALEACQKKATAYNGETCHVFDRDGGACRRQRCGDKIYDASTQACCQGRIHDRVTQGCCNGALFKTQTEGCCQGEIYIKAQQSCCGGQTLFDSNTHGCCLERGAQVYPFGTHNCCRRPKGTCRIRPGQASCCA
ncbi:unnamed protein product [Effrenium voratum]|uniref:Galaxin-like repeats domain-containing protein n=1 Tax=Effrenium voratum TaxID=2562239 RepID=A0AA36NEP7_9DINO|nr:unnamed protein product [Effrenium voratum]CAJ1445222.1 unnamed protein product [Effrenium voratum]